MIDNHICEKADSTRQRSYSAATKLSNSVPLINFVPTGRSTKDGKQLKMMANFGKSLFLFHSFTKQVT